VNAIRVVGTDLQLRLVARNRKARFLVLVLALRNTMS